MVRVIYLYLAAVVSSVHHLNSEDSHPHAWLPVWYVRPPSHPCRGSKLVICMLYVHVAAHVAVRVCSSCMQDVATEHKHLAPAVSRPTRHPVSVEGREEEVQAGEVRGAQDTDGQGEARGRAGEASGTGAGSCQAGAASCNAR